MLGVGSLFRVSKGGRLTFGNNVILGANNKVFCEKRIVMGDDVLSSWDCQFMDTDRHVITDLTTMTDNVTMADVVIGRHTWIGNGVTVNKGVRVPAESIIASHSLMNKDYSKETSNCVFAGIPAKVVAQNKKWRL